MELLQNGITLDTAQGVFPLSTDSILLADFARLPRNARVLDLGSGCGTLGLLLCAKDAGCLVTGIEIDSAAHDAALANIGRNGLSGRLSSICGDLVSITSQMQPGAFHCCISNPPYFSGGPVSHSVPLARCGIACTSEELFFAASRMLKYGGDFFLVHRPERLAELIVRGSAVQLEAKQLRLVRHKVGGPISLILLAFRKGGKPGLKIDEVALFEPCGKPTEYYKQVYHI